MNKKGKQSYTKYLYSIKNEKLLCNRARRDTVWQPLPSPDISWTQEWYQESKVPDVPVRGTLRKF